MIRMFPKANAMLMHGAIAASVFITANLPASAAPSEATLLSGEFGDERLIVAADPETKTVSGYYRDGECRVFFHDSLTPTSLYQRDDLGEAYRVRSWDPEAPTKIFSSEIYSRARGGYNDQITLEPNSDDATGPGRCRWRVSLDRAAHVSNAFIGVRVIRNKSARLFDVIVEGDVRRIIPQRTAPPLRGTGVWVTKTYGAAWSVKELVRISWYAPSGTPHGAYIRDEDLYPVLARHQEDGPDEACSVLQRGTFVSLGDCANAKADGSYAVKRNARKRLKFSSDGLAAIAIRGRGYAYVRRDGHALLVPTFDNAPDDFVDGLVRVKIGEKIGYADTGLSVVIPAHYDGAYPFAKGRARACIGCTSQSDGEHSWYKGGQNLCLNALGAERPAKECDAQP